MSKHLFAAPVLLALLTSAAYAAPTYQLRLHTPGLPASSAAPTPSPAPTETPPLVPSAPAPAPPPAKGTLALQNATLSFAAHPTLTHTQNVTVTNTGSAALTIEGLSIAGAASGKFAASGCVSEVHAGGSCTLRLVFAPGTGAAAANQSASLTITHNGDNPSQSVTLTGSSGYSPATPGYPGGTSPSFSGQTVSWPSSAGYGGFTVGSSWRTAGKYIVAFEGAPADLNALEFNVQETGGGFYGLSMPSRTIVKGGSAMVGGSSNGTSFARPTLVAGDSLVIAVDFENRSAAWLRCSGAGACSTLHSASGLSTNAMRVYAWKPGAGAVTVSVNSTGAKMSSPPAGHHNGMPQ